MSTVPPAYAKSPVKILSDSSPWQFFAEGAANIIFKYSPSSSSSSSANNGLEIDEGRLLRLRKDIPGNPTTLEVDKFIKSYVVPILGDFYVDMQLVELTHDFIHNLNKIEPAKGQRLDAPINTSEQHAFLMENVLSSSSSSKTKHYEKLKIPGISILLGLDDKLNSSTSSSSLTEVVVEFKPKWLLPSPDSVTLENVTHCRTCALALQRDKPIAFCPLDLISKDHQVFSQMISKLFGNNKVTDKIKSYAPATTTKGDFFPLVEILDKAMYRHPLFTRLQKLQKLDKRGILDYSADEDLDMDFLVATAARDCTVFISITQEKEDTTTVSSTPSETKLNSNSGNSFSSSLTLGSKSDIPINQEEDVTTSDTLIVQVGNSPQKYIVKFTVTDVDIKHPSEAKRTYWKKIEHSLQSDKWYQDKEHNPCNYYSPL